MGGTPITYKYEGLSRITYAQIIPPPHGFFHKSVCQPIKLEKEEVINIHRDIVIYSRRKVGKT